MYHGTKGYKWQMPTAVNQNEYKDDMEVLKAKVKILAQMYKNARFPCAFVGAGLSNDISITSLPSFNYFALTSLERNGYVNHVVQQSGDGMLQKSGFPQEKMNEIYGSWYDPSNPVGCDREIRPDLEERLLKIEKLADLCLCVGVDFRNEDRFEHIIRDYASRTHTDNKVAGLIIVDTKTTPIDQFCSLRIWAPLHDFFNLLATELEFEIVQQLPDFSDIFNTLHTGPFFVTYFVGGRLGIPNARMTWDLTLNQQVMITGEKAVNRGAIGVISKSEINSFGISIYFRESKESISRLLGVWWIRAALEERIGQLPITNLSPPVNKSIEFGQANKIISLPYLTPCGSPFTKYIKIIQAHVPLKHDTNMHTWSLQIDLDDCEEISHVLWHLHPTFDPPVVTCTEAPFKVGRIGWGTFEVNAQIFLKDGSEVRAPHELSFDKVGQYVARTVVQIH